MNMLVIESDAILRESLCECLRGLEGFTLLGYGENLNRALALAPHMAPIDILVVDTDNLALKEHSAWMAVRALLPETLIVALTGNPEKREIESIFQAGAISIHSTDISCERLSIALKKARAGKADYDASFLDVAAGLLATDEDQGQSRFGGLEIDLKKKSVTRWGIEIQLSPLELRVLAHLAERPGVPMSIEELLDDVWKASVASGGTSAQVRNCIQGLRAKIEPVPSRPRYILSRRGWGYLLRDPIQGGGKA